MKEVLQEEWTGQGTSPVILPSCARTETAESAGWLLRQRSGCVLGSTSVQENSTGPCTLFSIHPTPPYLHAAALCANKPGPALRAAPSQARRSACNNQPSRACMRWWRGQGVAARRSRMPWMLHDFCPFDAHASHLPPHTAMRCLSTGGDGDVAQEVVCSAAARTPSGYLGGNVNNRKPDIRRHYSEALGGRRDRLHGCRENWEGCSHPRLVWVTILAPARAARLRRSHGRAAWSRKRAARPPG